MGKTWYQQVRHYQVELHGWYLLDGLHIAFGLFHLYIYLWPFAEFSRLLCSP
jgi:hypothetical protein